MFKKKNKNYGSYDELHEGIFISKRDNEEFYPFQLDEGRIGSKYYQSPVFDLEAAEAESEYPMTKADYIKAGIFQVLDDKIIPGPNANKRYVKTKYGVEFYPEYVERRIKNSVYNRLASNRAPHLVSYSDFMRMSIDEIDSMYDPTKRNQEAWETRYRGQEKEFERRRKIWENDMRKNGKWWTDQAKQTIAKAHADSIVEYDKNLTALTLKAKSFSGLDKRVPENKIERKRLQTNIDKSNIKKSKHSNSDSVLSKSVKKNVFKSNPKIKKKFKDRLALPKKKSKDSKPISKKGRDY